jgi:sterol desaturase/sphingolipid hydroxylase (fatty acid hydroxylase superfamily)
MTDVSTFITRSETLPVHWPTQWLTHLGDDLVLFWSLVTFTILLDKWLDKTGLWKYFKHTKKPNAWPDSATYIGMTILFNQFFILGGIMLTAEIWGFHSRSGTIWEWSNLYRFPIAVLTEEILFFYAHVLLHTSWFYENVHKIHHSWVYPSGIAAYHCHPIEHAICNVIPVLVAGWVANLSFETARLWHFISVISAILSHSGYVMFSFHYLHHVNYYINYGVIGWMDNWHGTSV